MVNHLHSDACRILTGRAGIRAELGRARHLAATWDGYARDFRAWLSVSASFIDPESTILRQRFLGLTSLPVVNDHYKSAPLLVQALDVRTISSRRLFFPLTLH
jgi:hypothetical protein